MTEFSDLSVEVAHISLDDLDEEKADIAAKTAAGFIKHILSAAHDQQRTINTTILIDDYFSMGKLSLASASELILGACQDHGIIVDHIVSESACAIGIETMFDLIIEQPRKGAGSRGGEISSPARAAGWLSNGDSMRLTYENSMGDPFARSQKEIVAAEPRYSHALFLDVQLWLQEAGRRLYSCAALAAWWQLMRLGVDEGDDGLPRLPDSIISRPEATPFFALNTLSVLSIDFLEIEHAVRTILSQVFIPESARKRWRRGPSEPSHQGHLERIAYIFMPDDYRLFD